MDVITEAKSYQAENKLSTDEYIFSVNDEPLSYYSIKKLLMSYCNEIGTANKSSHKIRKTFVNAVFENGIKISRISDIVGHNDTRTTFKHYCHDCEEQDTLVEQFENALYKKNK